MIAFIYPFRRLSAFCIIVLAMLAMACNEGEKLSKTLATIAVPETSLSNSHRTWIFLTDEDGELLGEGQQAHEGIDLVFERPKGFKGNTFTLTRVFYDGNTESKYSEFTLYSYTGVKAGKFSLPEVYSAPHTVIGNAVITVTNVPFGYSPNLAGPGASGLNASTSGSTVTITVSLIENGQWMACNFSGHALNGRVPRYTYFNSVSAGDIKTISFNDMLEAEQSTINLSSEVEIAQITLGHEVGGLLDFYNVYNTATPPLYYPDNFPGTFRSSIALYNGNDYQAYFRVGSILTTMKTVSATIGSLDVTDDEVSFTTSGSYDYLTLYSSEVWEHEGWEYYLSWRVYTNDDENKRFNIPAFPEVITTDYPEIINIPKNFNLIALTDTDRHSGYADFIKEQLKGDQPLEPLTETLVTRKAFSSGGRKFGKAQLEQFEIKP